MSLICPSYGHTLNPTFYTRGHTLNPTFCTRGHTLNPTFDTGTLNPHPIRKPWQGVDNAYGGGVCLVAGEEEEEEEREEEDSAPTTSRHTLPGRAGW